jgi:hypothetical protein
MFENLGSSINLFVNTTNLTTYSKHSVQEHEGKIICNFFNHR